MSPTGSTGVRRRVHELDLPVAVGQGLDQLVVSPANALISSRKRRLLAAPDSVTWPGHAAPVHQPRPRWSGRRYRPEDHRGDAEAPSSAASFGRSPSGAMLAHSSSMSTRPDSRRRVGDAAWWRDVSTTSSMRAATIRAN